MANTKISWCDKVWNPVTGCTKVSEGCHNCYAEKMAKRLQAMGQPHYANGFGVTCHEDALDTPLRWRKPARIFVNSMSDLFHKDVPIEFIWRIIEIAYQASQHDFLILTKRPDSLFVCVLPVPHVLPRLCRPSLRRLPACHHARL